MIICALVGCAESDEGATSAPEAPADPAAAIRDALRNEFGAPPETAPWRYSSGVDEMRGTTHRVACTLGLETEDREIAIDPSLILCLRWSSDGAEDATLIAGEMIDCAAVNCALAIKLDDGDVSSWRIDYPDGAGRIQYNMAVFLDRARAVRGLRGAQEVMIEMPLYDSGRRRFLFETRNLIWPPPSENVQ